MENKEKLKETIVQFIKFGTVGAINTVLSYAITNGAYYLLHLHEQISNIIAFVITVFISFMLNGKFVFTENKEERNFWKSLLKVYASYSVTGVFLTAILLYIEEELLGIPHYIATLMNLVVTIPVNFILNKFWAYKEKKRGIKMKLLMHTCCAPCSVYCIDRLRKEGIEPTVYWYNPNIHPYKEYEARRECLREYTKSVNVNAIFEEDYGLKEFCKNTINDLENRCTNYCYKVRLEKTVQYAKQNGYDTFTSTLFVSPYQKHEELKKICEELAEKYDMKFLYIDFRVGFREGQAKARELGLYMQKYCGCIFSEEDRYIKQIKRDKENQ